MTKSTRNESDDATEEDEAPLRGSDPALGRWLIAGPSPGDPDETGAAGNVKSDGAAAGLSSERDAEEEADTTAGDVGAAQAGGGDAAGDEGRDHSTGDEADDDATGAVVHTDAAADTEENESLTPQVMDPDEDRLSAEELAVIGKAPPTQGGKGRKRIVAVALLLLLLTFVGYRYGGWRQPEAPPDLAAKPAERSAGDMIRQLFVPDDALEDEAPPADEEQEQQDEARGDEKRRAKRPKVVVDEDGTSNRQPARASGPAVARYPDLDRSTLDRLERESEKKTTEK